MSGLKSYLQFIFIKDLDQVDEDELSEALRIKQNSDETLNNSTFKLEFGQNKCFLLGFHCPQVVTITTSKKAFICFWTRLTNLHWITRLSEKTDEQ